MDESEWCEMEDRLKDEKAEDMEIKRWPCQDLHGGRMPFLNVDDEGECNHEECNPINID